METAITTVRQLPETKAQIEIFAHQLEQGLTNGQIIPSDLLRFQKAMEKVFEKIKPVLIETTLDEIEKYGKSAVLKGAEFSIIEAGTKYDYSGCNDAKWNDLSKELESIKDKLKERETFLKSIKEKLEIIDTESGELNIINPCVKSSSTTLKVTFK